MNEEGKNCRTADIDSCTDNKNEGLMEKDSENTAHKKPKKSTKREIAEWLAYILAGLIIGYYISIFFKLGIVVGNSMNNTLQNHDLYTINERAYKSEAPKYKDIVVLNSDINGGELLIKRVIGTPGDHLVIASNHLYINGKLIEEDYIKEPMEGNKDIAIDIPEDMIFVMGDNRNNSADSRVIGLVDYKKDVIGKVTERIFPLNKIEDFSNK